MKILIMIAVGVGICATISAWAARAGRIDVKDTPIYDGPGKGYRLLGKIAKGSPVAASNVAIQGFYKIRTSAGKIGFVPADTIDFSEAIAGSKKSGESDLPTSDGPVPASDNGGVGTAPTAPLKVIK